MRNLVEGQVPRNLRRYLDYGQRVKADQGMGELYQWIGKILLDDGSIYPLEDQGLAFEIAAVERIADLWSDFQGSLIDQVLITGKVDKIYLYRQILLPDNPLERKAAYFEVLRARYKKICGWIGERAADRPPAQDSFGISASANLFEQFLEKLEAVDPLPDCARGSQGGRRELEEARDQISVRDAEIAELNSELEFAEDRAGRAHQRLRELGEQEKKLHKQLRDARENGEKLRAERSRRIKFERQASQVGRELENLRTEYVKLDQRLQKMAQRLSVAEEDRAAAIIDLSGMRRLEPPQVLGAQGPLSEREITQIRRQFAQVFHPDRVERLPAWVGKLFDELLGVVNGACDRMKK